MNGKTKILDIINSNRILDFQYRLQLEESPNEQDILDLVVEYIDDYINYKNLSPEQVLKIHDTFLCEFREDIQNFKLSGRYPLEMNPNRQGLDPVGYNVVLLLSILFTRHRLKLMAQIRNHRCECKKALFVGCGPGFEIELTKDRCNQVTCYDPGCDDFLFYRHQNITIKREVFKGRAVGTYDAIYLVELLEHLEDPYALLADCARSLADGGLLYLTTATNIPQFDHVYNFPENHDRFDEELKKCGLTIRHSTVIKHEYYNVDIHAQNKFYVVQREGSAGK